MDLIVSNGQPSVAAPYQQAIDAGKMDQRHQRGVLDPADAAAFQVEHRHPQQFREKQEVFRH